MIPNRDLTEEREQWERNDACQARMEARMYERARFEPPDMDPVEQAANRLYKERFQAAEREYHEACDRQDRRNQRARNVIIAIRQRWLWYKSVGLQRKAQRVVNRACRVLGGG